ncbi:MAG: sulfotransferase [Verrucomicrobiota bacterium]
MAHPDLQAFCLFASYGRSGHSLVGSLLDAHPDVVIAHEANALRLVAEGTKRDELFRTLLENSRRSFERGRRQSGYSYVVEGQWQGRYRTLRVIGDKSGGRTTKLIGRAGLRRFARTVGLPLRIVHQTRNPYDIVARRSLVLRDGVPKRTIEEATADLAAMTDVNERLIREGKYPVITLRHEALIAEPQGELARLCEFVGVEPESDYLDACAGIVYESPHRTRDRVEWSDAQLSAVDEIVARHHFLRGYSFDGY